MRFGVLGPLEIVGEDGPVAVTAAKERLVLAVLIAQANRVVSVERLIDELWESAPPRSAGKTLQTYISHLRGVLGEGIETQPAGYRLEIGDAQLDAAVFEAQAGEGRLALLRRQPALAAELLGAALSLWRGEAFAGLGPASGVVYAERVFLGELRLAVLEDWVEARLAAGEDRELVADLEGMVAVAPLREKLWQLLMTALYQQGRQSDALGAYQRARRVLIEELGLEPGPGLRETERQILGQTLSVSSQQPAPAVAYTTNADGLRIGYWCRGDRPVDVVFVGEATINIELLGEISELEPFLIRLGGSRRLIAMQRRGTGISDRDPAGFADPEACVGDIAAVVEACRSRVHVVVGWGHGGQVALAYAARRPDRTRALVLINSFARVLRAPDYTPGVPSEDAEVFLKLVGSVWGQPVAKVPIFSLEAGTDPALIERVARIERLSLSPREVIEVLRAIWGFDVRWALGLVSCPALVVGLRSSTSGLANAIYLADRIPGAQYVELDGHFVPTAEEAVAVGEAVSDFLQGLPG